MSNAAEMINENFLAGSVVESGSNGNGNYVKFGNGTMICWDSKRTLVRESGYLLRNKWTFPVPFKDTNVAIFLSIGSMTSGSYPTAATKTQAVVRTAALGELALIGRSEIWIASDVMETSSFAIGSWK